MTNTNNCNYTLKSFEKNNYFYGKLMTVRDFQLQSDFHEGQLQMVNRLIHGVGVVCGLEVSNSSSASKITVQTDNGPTFYLTSGAALDCCGREIVVPKEYNGNIIATKNYTNETTLYVYLKYRKEDFENVPVGGNSSCGSESCCPNRSRETFSIEVSKDMPTTSNDIGLSTYDIDKNLKNDLQANVTAISGAIAYLKGKVDIGDNKWKEMEAKTLATIQELIKLYPCSSCSDTDAKVLLAVIDNTGNVKPNETLQYRNIVLSNPLLYGLLSAHIHDTDNPHNVTAAQVQALQTLSANDSQDINKVGNKGNNVFPNITFKSNTGAGKIDIAAVQGNDPAITLILANDAVTMPKIANGSVTEGKIANDAVTTPKIEDSNVTESKIANNAVTNNKIADNTITQGKLAFKVVTSVNGVAPVNTTNGAITVDHATTNPQGYGTPATDPTKNKHVSNADATKWNSAIYTINDMASDNNGAIKLTSNDNSIEITSSANTIDFKVLKSSTGGVSCFSFDAVLQCIQQCLDKATYDKIAPKPSKDGYALSNILSFLKILSQFLADKITNDSKSYTPQSWKYFIASYAELQKNIDAEQIYEALKNIEKLCFYFKLLEPKIALKPGIIDIARKYKYKLPISLDPRAIQILNYIFDNPTAGIDATRVAEAMKLSQTQVQEVLTQFAELISKMK